jgi:hypothetical protein
MRVRVPFATSRGSIVSDADLQRKAELDKATSNLDEGLKSCRAVITGYRALLAASEQPAELIRPEDDCGKGAVPTA